MFYCSTHQNKLSNRSQHVAMVEKSANFLISFYSNRIGSTATSYGLNIFYCSIKKGKQIGQNWSPLTDPLLNLTLSKTLYCVKMNVPMPDRCLVLQKSTEIHFYGVDMLLHSQNRIDINQLFINVTNH